MSVRLRFIDDTSRTIAWARVTPEPVEFRRRQYRPPFSGAWRTAGDARIVPDLFRLSFEIANDAGMNASAADAREVLADVARATSIESYVGVFNMAGILSTTKTVIENGYRLDVLVSSNPGRVDVVTGDGSPYAGDSSGFAGDSTRYAGESA